MLDKKGFTLLEVTISVALLSLVMVFMFRLLNNVRRDEDSISLSTELLLNKAILSKNINKIIRDGEGILSATCDNMKCDLTLKDGSKKRLELTNSRKVLMFSDVTSENRREISKELPEGFNYNIRKVETDYLTVITLVVDSHEEYNIEIIDYKVS